MRLIFTERTCVTVCDSMGSFVIFEPGRVIEPDYVDRDASTFIIAHGDGVEDFTEYRYPSRGLKPVSSLTAWEQSKFAREISQ